MTSAIQQCKFSDILQDKKKFELYVGSSDEIPTHFNIYDESRADFFVLTIVTQGQATIRVNTKEQKLSGNSVFFMLPNTVKQLISKTEDMRFYSVIFTSKFLLQTGIEKQEIELFNFARSNEDAILLEEMELQTLKKVVDDLKSKSENTELHPFGDDILKYTFRIFLSEISGIAVRHRVYTRQKVSRKQDLVSQFGKLVNLHFRENRSVKFYADQLAITPKYLSEIVQEVTGESASVIIDEKVMYEAKKLLDNPRLSIAQIADALHFSDQSFLGKFFKRHLGLSPSQYRNHHLV